MKRGFDISAAAAGLLLLSPVLAVLALLVKLSDWGPVFYRQERVGQFGRKFKILKFRSMVLNADKIGALVTRDRDPRITRVGRFLRKTKLDELPQLWNVLVGEMSFVGPRPEVPRYVAQYSQEQSRILQYRPGITDMATVLFRNEEELLKSVDDVEKFYVQHCVPKKLELNFRYQEKASIWTDLGVIAQTLLPYWLIVFGLYGFVLLTSLAVSYYVRFEGMPPSAELLNLPHQILFLVLLQLLFLTWRGHSQGLLSYFGALEIRSTAVRLLGAACCATALWFAFSGAYLPPRSVIITDTFVAFTFIVFTRFSLKMARDRFVHRAASGSSARTRVVVIGANDLAARFIHDHTLAVDSPYEVVGLFDDDPSSWQKRIHGVEVMGMPEQALSEEWKSKFDEAVLTVDDQTGRSEAIARNFQAADRKIRRLVTGLVDIERGTEK